MGKVDTKTTIPSTGLSFIRSYEFGHLNYTITAHEIRKCIRKWQGELREYLLLWNDFSNFILHNFSFVVRILPICTAQGLICTTLSLAQN